MTIKYSISSVIQDNHQNEEVMESNKQDEIQKKAESDVQKALDETGFGIFNYKIIIIACLICMNVSFGTMSVGFILPSAACDFKMNTIDKGYISTAPMFGRVFGSIIWGCIANTFGRRKALVSCVFLYGIFECVSSVVSNYWAFLALKFLSGLAQSGQMTILCTYLGEFQPTKYREKVLSLIEIPWTLGTILVPILAWFIIPINIEFTYAAFSFKSWNLFIIMCAVPSFVIVCVLLSLPETPKYLASIRCHSDLRNVLTSMYHQNTGKPTEEYIAKLNTVGVMYFDDRDDGYANESRRRNNDVNDRNSTTTTTINGFYNLFQTLRNQSRLLWKPPYIGRTIIVCVGAYCSLASLYSLTLWFPELFQRFADFETKHPGEETSVCIISQSLSQPAVSNETIVNFSLTILQKEALDLSSIKDCVSTIDSQVYIHSLIMGLACIPMAILFPLCIDRLGFRLYLVCNTFACFGVTIALICVTSSTQNLILSCFYEAFSSVCATVILCLVVELFPTTLRATVSALVSISGRLGALSGNATFGYLLDDHCLLAIFIVAAYPLVAGILGLFLPRDKQKKSQQHQQEKIDVPGICNHHPVTARYSSTEP